MWYLHMIWQVAAILKKSPAWNDFSIQIKYDLVDNFAKIHLPDSFFVLGCRVMECVKPCMMYEAHSYVNMKSIVTFIHRIYV